MNKSLNKFLIVLSLAVLCSQNAFAQKTLVATRDMPLELNLLIKTLQEQAPENYNRILPLILNIDLYARSMTKEDIFLIGKVEIYKTLLKNYDDPIKQPVNGATISALRSGLTGKDDYFTKWFLRALLTDAVGLLNNPAYKEFVLLKKNNEKIEKIEYKKMEKKAELIQYWAAKIPQQPSESLDALKSDLTPKMFDALKNIQNSFYLMAKEASLPPIPDALKNESELKYFTIIDQSPKAPPLAKEQKSVEEILSPLTDSIKPQDLPAPSQENWLEDENSPASLQNLPKPKNDADWLEDF